MKSRTSTARAIGSLIVTALFGGTKLLTKLLWSLRRARGKVKKGARSFYKELVDSGIPEEVAREITISYAEPTLQMLKVRNMIRMIGEITD